MGHETILPTLLSLEGNEASHYFRGYLRDSVRLALIDIMNHEVELLCGPSHIQGNTAEAKRAGSEQGIFYQNGKKQSIKRPRVRKDGKEVNLESYALARDIDNISDDVLRAVECGVSSRDFDELQEGESISRSEFSRLWAAKGAARLEELRSRNLGSIDFFCLMLDGVHLSKDLTAVVALGIDSFGIKHVLDFSLGCSENLDVAKDLMKRLIDRGFSCAERRLLCVLDGSDALKKAVKAYFPDALMQRCLVHKERNLHSYLKYTDRSECTRLMNRLRKAQGEEDGEEALDELKEFVGRKNAAALASLKEAEDELLTLHKLNVPATLNRALLSTNAIENTIRNIRKKINRNNRWRPETGQADRWLASGLLYAEKGFRRIVGCEDLPKLIEALADYSEVAHK